MKKLLLSLLLLSCGLLNSQNISLEWSKQFGDIGRDRGFSSKVFSNNHIYSTGAFRGTVDFDPSEESEYLLTSKNEYYDIYIQKLDLDGNFIWAKSIGGIGDDAGLSLDVDSNGNIYATGYFRETVDFNPDEIETYPLTANHDDVFILKLDIDGAFMWVKSFGINERDYGRSIVVDESANIYSTGFFQGTVDFDPDALNTFELNSNGEQDVFIQKLDTDGNFVWAKSFGSILDDTAQSITVDSNENVYTCGYFQNTVDFDPGIENNLITSNGGYDIFIQKLNIDGELEWINTIGGVGNDNARSIHVDADYNVYTTGSFTGTIDFNSNKDDVFNKSSNGAIDSYIQKLDSDGQMIWTKTFGGTSNDLGQSIITDNNANIYTCGFFHETVDFDPSEAALDLVSNGRYDTYINKLNKDGELIWAESFGGLGDDYGRDLTIDDDLNIYTLGYFQNTVDFDVNETTYNLNSKGSDDIFLLKLSQCIPSLLTPNLETLGNLIHKYEITPTAPKATNDCNKTIIATPNVTFPVTEQGETIITWTYNDGYQIITQQQKVIITGTTLSINESQLDNIIFYPNPATRKITISVGHLENVFIKIFNMQGSLLLSKSISNINNQISLNYDAGIYYVEVSSKKGNKRLKLIIKN